MIDAAKACDLGFLTQIEAAVIPRITIACRISSMVAVGSSAFGVGIVHSVAEFRRPSNSPAFYRSTTFETYDDGCGVTTVTRTG